MTSPTLKDLIQTLPQLGRLVWIGLRPARGEPMVRVDSAIAEIGLGLEGDRFKGRPESKRQVTLIQAEHLPAMASLLHLPDVPPELLRRNLMVSGLNLLALKNRQFRIGNVVLEMTGLCHPCSKMEAIFGPGGYNAIRGHGGITAKVVAGGTIREGDTVSVIAS
ncbi:MOSC domain-containing protein [Marinobacter fonticola]|uniref:MOSC domain-containing protein n=1 Tax=Marinobacter fonticola TaxID=2603215 RepID=UPI00193100DB|nr:MOSC domain-containing protein [Marinobacter fonticola]